MQYIIRYRNLVACPTPNTWFRLLELLSPFYYESWGKGAWIQSICIWLVQLTIKHTETEILIINLALFKYYIFIIKYMSKVCPFHPQMM